MRQWDLWREADVVLDGTSEIRIAERRLADLGQRDYFDALAALGWGAIFGYPRLASVSATSRVQLLVFPDASFNTLARDVPRSDNEIRRAVRERLRGL